MYNMYKPHTCTHTHTTQLYTTHTHAHTHSHTTQHKHIPTFLCKSLRALPSSTPRLVFLNPTWLLRLRDNVPLSEGARRSRGDWLPDKVRLGGELMIQSPRIKSMSSDCGWLSRVIYSNTDRSALQKGVQFISSIVQQYYCKQSTHTQFTEYCLQTSMLPSGQTDQ